MVLEIEIYIYGTKHDSLEKHILLY